MKNIIITIVSILVFCSIGAAQEEAARRKVQAFSGSLMLGAGAGMTIGFTDYDQIKPQIVGRGMLEYFFPTSSSGIFSIRTFIKGGYVGGKDDSRTPTAFRATLTRLGGGIAYNFSIQDKVFPYVFLGASYGWVNPKDNDGTELPYSGRDFDIAEENYHAEVGMRFLLSEKITFNLSVGAELSPHDNWDAVNAGGNNDFLMQIMGGFAYSLFTESDSDGDGIEDSEDQCPNTPIGVTVDNFGCPIDEDNDGVPDYKDKCPNTKAGFEVDENGCVIDSDKDGVPDKLDKCANTPVGANVSESGCPDTDGDGVYDNEDKCDNTPENAPVDMNGCPKDSDKDGVADYKDECPNTPEGQQVDSDGCATKKDTVKLKLTLSGDTNFEFDKATLLPAAYSVLNTMAETMKDNPDLRWRIEGHTDAVGSDAYNMELSRRRAQSVADYLLNKGVERDRLEIVPMGETQPIASNETDAGRAMNRRVEIEPINYK